MKQIASLPPSDVTAGYGGRRDPCSSSVVECLPGIHGVLSSMPNTGNKPAKGLLKKQTVIICAGKGDVTACKGPA